MTRYPCSYRCCRNNTLLGSVRKFCVRVPSGQRAKVSLIKLIMEDFRQQTNQLVRLSTEDLCKVVSPPPDRSRLQLPLTCQFVHNRYSTTIASHLPCQQTRWDPPEQITDNVTVLPVNWLQVPVNQHKSRLSKVDASVIRGCCNLYLSPEAPPQTLSFLRITSLCSHVVYLLPRYLVNSLSKTFSRENSVMKYLNNFFYRPHWREKMKRRNKHVVKTMRLLLPPLARLKMNTFIHGLWSLPGPSTGRDEEMD